MAQYTETAPSFVSETGMQSFPDLKTALSIGGEEDRHVQSYLFDTRNHFMSTAKNERLLKFAGSLFRVSSNFDEMVILSNLAHGEYLRCAVEHWRTQAYDCGGILLWQLNDCWPAISWAAIDYYMQPKACHYYMKRAYAKELVVFRQNQSPGYNADEDKYGELLVVSDRDEARSGNVTLRMCSLLGIEQERMCSQFACRTVGFQIWAR
jgi:beta-mannosidase